LLQALDPAQMPASTLGGEAWIPLIGPPGNTPVSGSKGPEQLAVRWRRHCGGGAQFSRLWPLSAGVREPERKNLTFSFPGGSRGMFSLRRPQEGNGNARELPARRGRKARRRREPSGLSRLVAGGPLEKSAKLKRCNILFLALKVQGPIIQVGTFRWLYCGYILRA
jgi:hypothetical protein